VWIAVFKIVEALLRIVCNSCKYVFCPFFCGVGFESLEPTKKKALFLAFRFTLDALDALGALGALGA
jgi:hypothetical protein